MTITDASFTYERKGEQIAAEAALDGIYVLRTSVLKERLDAPDVVRSYKQLKLRDERPPEQTDPVAKAKRSSSAADKARRKRTARGEAPHSFESLIAELSLQTRNTIRVGDSEASFERLAEPNAVQVQALELVESIPKQA